MKWLVALLLGTLLLGLLMGCDLAFPAETTPPVTTSPPDIWGNPAAYLGQEVALEGILEAEGPGLDVRFFLRGPGEARLQVTAWAPLEVMHPPTGEGPVPHTMLDYVGKHLRLTGVVARAGQSYILNVGKAEEVP